MLRRAQRPPPQFAPCSRTLPHPPQVEALREIARGRARKEVAAGTEAVTVAVQRGIIEL